MYRGRERRRHPRVEGRPLALRIDGRKYKTLNWSLGGFKISGYHAEMEPGDKIEGTIGPVAGVGPGPFVAEVVRVTEDGEVGLRLLEVLPAVFVAMSGMKTH